jgi:hypothetical protein
MNFSIHIFCGTSFLFKLIRKTFVKESYSFGCSEIKENCDNFIVDLNYNPDCIIIDKDINEYFKDKIINKYLKTKIILLPSLDFEQKSISNNVIQISEPFKLSELGEVIKEIYYSKQIEQSAN